MDSKIRRTKIQDKSIMFYSGSNVVLDIVESIPFPRKASEVFEREAARLPAAHPILRGIEDDIRAWLGERGGEGNVDVMARGTKTVADPYVLDIILWCYHPEAARSLFKSSISRKFARKDGFEL